MSDIVKKLRDLEQWIREPEGKSFTLSFDLFDEAADEIERLRAENARLRTGLRAIAGARPRCCEISDAMQGIARAALAEPRASSD